MSDMKIYECITMHLEQKMLLDEIVNKRALLFPGTVLLG